MNKAGFIKDAPILFVITLVSGCLLDGAYQVTREPIEKVTIAVNNEAYKVVFNEAESFEPDDAPTAAVEGCNVDLTGMDSGGAKVENVLKAVDGSGSQLGCVITSLSNDSYGGTVKVSAGVKEDGTTIGIEFLETSDTPGLEFKAKELKFKDRFIGKNAESLSVIKMGDADDTQINATSGATITSSVTTSAMNAALYYLRNCVK